MSESEGTKAALRAAITQATGEAPPASWTKERLQERLHELTAAGGAGGPEAGPEQAPAGGGGQGAPDQGAGATERPSHALPPEGLGAPLPGADEEPETPPEQARPEVAPEEFSRGIDKPVAGSALPTLIEDELRKPLDPNRVRTRKGRGSGQFEYLAGHDVKRRANELFGFGCWGSQLVELREIAAVEVTTEDGKKGWHIGYSAVCRVTVRGCEPVSDVGYGDGVEYGPAAYVTARELAMKEAATDAMKRALTQYGDQFGLILYAKKDEKQRIERDSNAGQTRGTVRQDSDPVPRSWPEINEWAAAYGEPFGWPVWLQQATTVLFGTEKAEDKTKLTAKDREILGQKASTVIYRLRKQFDPNEMPPLTRAAVQEEWAKVLDGAILPGPEWQFDRSDTDLPTFEEANADPEGEDIEFGGEGPYDSTGGYDG